MYKLFNVDNNKRSKVKGFWLDNGKVVIDNIHIIQYRQRQQLRRGVRALFKQGEKAVFYKCGNDYASIEYADKRIERLQRKDLLRRDKLSIKEIKSLIKAYGGLTVYDCKRSRGIFYIEIFVNSNI